MKQVERVIGNAVDLVIEIIESFIARTPPLHTHCAHRYATAAAAETLVMLHAADNSNRRSVTSRHSVLVGYHKCQAILFQPFVMFA